MIIWIASYPKSGNTWVRSMIGSLLYTEDGIFNFEILDKIKQFPSIKYFSNFTNDYQNIDEIKKNWILAQDKINLDNRVKFLKTHNANCKIGNHYFTNKSNTLASIYIVRDPRNIVTSMSNHFNFDIDYSKKFITTERSIGGNQTIKASLMDNNIITILGAWNNHVLSWTQNNSNLLIIRYEDLVKDIELETDRLINFIKKYMNIEISRKKIQNCIESTSFKNLTKLEDSKNFTEVANKNIGTNKKFFYLGENNKWQKFLDKKTVEYLEIKFKKEMAKFGYLNQLI